MKIELVARPSYAMAVARLEPGETLSVEAGSMVAMRGVEVDTRLATGIFLALVRKLFGGESMFLNHYKAGSGGGEVYVAPALVGDIVQHTLTGGEVLVQGSSFLGSTPGVSVTVVWAGLRMLFGKEGAFFLRCAGRGELLINAYGGIELIEVDGMYTVDTGHVVAYEPSLKPRIRRVGGLKATLFSGEGLVMDFQGRGRLWIQTRSLSALVGWISPMLPS
jgi:uncharacterized protein (TIGR00266 family)